MVENDPSRDDPDPEKVQEASKRRKHEMSEHSEHIIEEVQMDFGDHDYPVRGEELAAEYSTEEIDLANETESLGSVFDRLSDETFESADEVREAVYGEITGEAAGRSEANPERDLGEIGSDGPADSNRDL
jgi:hypothetical protein